MKNVLILFAPKFKELGVDVAKNMQEKFPDIKITGICTGGATVVNYVKGSLGPILVDIYDLENMEEEWLEQNDHQIDYNYLSEIDKSYGVGAVGEVITADRRVGLGLVRGGLTRPDYIGDQAIRNPNEVPQKYVQGLFLFIEGIFDRYNFCGVFCYAVAGGPAVALAKVCKARNSIFTRLNVTRIGDGFVIDTDYKGCLEPVAERFLSAEELPQSVLDKAANFLIDYRNQPAIPGYMAYNNKMLKENRLLPLLGKFAVYSTAFCVKNILPEKYKIRLNLIGVKRKLFELMLEWRKVRFDYSVFDSDPPSCAYVFYPLHVDPEASTMVMSPMHTDQISVIEAISKSLPGNKVLVVKEHLPMVGKRNQEFYQAIKNMPRVKLVSPLLSAHELIKSSAGVVVITGTAAFEANIMGKKAIVVGDSPYLAMGTGLIHETSLSKLPDALEKLEVMPEPEDEKIIRYIGCLLSESFNMKTSLLWGDYLSHSEPERHKAVKDISASIIEKIVQ
ncbi:hypothetical protein [Oceanimonas sp. MB9]|uniref:hypothetical protein n=1 Tax=Oceanimonas sp. MB9 TaxID=2588453 RepID=UPI0013F5B649|nr:hypothetical protein [Oceanimonas sp. MB9]NHI01397.1 hypothetical protein [Oceanimonas sp. MB9]